MKILVLDNYDSFVYNLVHIIKALGYQLDVFRNDKIALAEIEKYDKILLSPGPGIPSEAGIMLDLIQKYASTKSILGVCLGHQAIAEVFGAKLKNLPQVLHGIDSEAKVINENILFKNLPKNFKVGHYHSWVVDKSSLNKNIKVTIEDKEGNIMGLAHTEYDVRGVQFHPESIMTEYGKEMIKNWLNN